MSTHDNWYHVIDKMTMKSSIVAIDHFQGHYVIEGFGAFFDVQSCD